MLKRTKKKVATKSTIKRKTKKAPSATAAAKRKKTLALKKKETTANKAAQWKTFRELKAKVNEKLAKLKNDYQNEVKPEVLHEDLKMLTLLGGEVHYMVLELEKMQKKGAKPRKTAKKVAKKRTVRRKAKK